MMIRMTTIALLLAMSALPATAQARTAAAQAQSSSEPIVLANDRAAEAEIGAALGAVYGAISGPAGQPRDWAKMRTLFTPNARLTAIGANGLNGMTVDEYIAKSGPTLTSAGFTERELARKVEIFGDLAHAWSSYEGVGNGGRLKVRGINSFQLVRQNGKWLVQSIFWQAEAPTRPLPADMLPVAAK